MLNNILDVVNKYATGVKQVEDRRAEWLEKHKELKDHLKMVADYLNTHTTYKQGFFIDTLHAFNEDMNGACAEMPSIAFRSGEMPMQVTFRNAMGEKKELVEKGFHITFTPTITGQIIVLLLPHYSDLNPTPPAYATLAVITDPAQLTMEIADNLISNGIQAAYYTSYTGMAEPEEKNEQPKHHVPKHNPIGFKRYETTEKIK